MEIFHFTTKFYSLQFFLPDIYVKMTYITYLFHILEIESILQHYDKYVSCNVITSLVSVHILTAKLSQDIPILLGNAI